MFDFLLLPEVIPLGAILFDFLFLLVAIPIEAYVLHNRLKFDLKTSSFYAMSINLFSNALGWIIFFFLEPFLPAQIKAELINYIFFVRFTSDVQSLIILSGFIFFFATFLMKVLILKLLLISLTDPGKAPTTEPTLLRRNSRRGNRIKIQNTNLVTTVLIGNALSYSAIVAILFLIPRN